MSGSFHSLPSSNRPTPPQRGSFPLDHDGECKHLMTLYLACTKTHHHFYEPCQALSKQYLECRMERELMAPADLTKWGFEDEHKAAIKQDGARDGAGQAGGDVGQGASQGAAAADGATARSPSP